MLSSKAISVNNLSKRYEIYRNPSDRLKQFFMPRLKSIFGITKNLNYYQDFWALRNISFDVFKGETVGIIGRNGSGKSTLLQLICGTLNPTGGGIQAQGRIAALLELGSGFNPEFSGRENIFLNAALLGLTQEQILDRYQRIIEFADIGEFVEQPVKTYSSGMLVRLAFAVIAHVDADILIIDEALAVGDAIFTQKCMRFLRNFMKSGTVLFVSHDIGSVKNLCSKAIWLDKGEILNIGAAKEVCEGYLEATYQHIKSDRFIAPKSQNVKTHALPVREARDQRQDFINNTSLRNDIKVFDFDPLGASFGDHKATINNVALLDSQGAPLRWVVGGEDVCLMIQAVAHSELNAPIIGFFIKDRLGQTLFGDNTFLACIHESIVYEAAEELKAEFKFQMPRLPIGDYSITVAIASGTQDENQQHHWIHDAVLFKSTATSVASGLIGIPMQKITLKKEQC